MPKLDLTSADAELLLEMAEEWLWDLRQEARRSDTPDYRDRVKAKQALLERVLEDLTVCVG